MQRPMMHKWGRCRKWSFAESQQRRKLQITKAQSITSLIMRSSGLRRKVPLFVWYLIRRLCLRVTSLTITGWMAWICWTISLELFCVLEKRKWPWLVIFPRCISAFWYLCMISTFTMFYGGHKPRTGQIRENSINIWGQASSGDGANCSSQNSARRSSHQP